MSSKNVIEKIRALEADNVELKTKVKACVLALKELTRRTKEMEQIYTLIDNVENFERELFDEMEKARSKVMCHYEESLRHFTDLIKVNKMSGMEAENNPKVPVVHRIGGIEINEGESDVKVDNIKEERELRPWEKNMMKSKEAQPEYTNQYKSIVLGESSKDEKKEVAVKEIPEEAEEAEKHEKEVVTKNVPGTKVTEKSEEIIQNKVSSDDEKKVEKKKPVSKVITKTKTNTTSTAPKSRKKTIKPKPTTKVVKRTSTRIKKKTPVSSVKK